MRHKVLVGTFHKTGTVLMREVLKGAAAELGLTIWRMDDRSGRAPPAEW